MTTQEIAEQKGYAQKYVNECIVLNRELAEQSARLQELERDAGRLKAALHFIQHVEIRAGGNPTNSEMWLRRFCEETLAGKDPTTGKPYMDAALAADAAGGKHD